MAQRLVRAKAQDPRRPHPVPGAARRRPARAAARRAGRRLPGVQRGLRRPAAARSSCATTCAARRSGSAALLRELMPDEPEAAGLLALMLLAESRRAARTDADGELVPLAEQDRARWDRALIAEGRALVRACLRRDQPGPYQIQAAIQAVHSDAPTAAAPTGGRSSRSTTSCSRSPRPRWWRSTAPSRWPRSTGPATALALVDAARPRRPAPLPRRPRRPAAPPGPDAGGGKRVRPSDRRARQRGRARLPGARRRAELV